MNGNANAGAGALDHQVSAVEYMRFYDGTVQRSGLHWRCTPASRPRAPALTWPHSLAGPGGHGPAGTELGVSTCYCTDTGPRT
jgi:hypothetical protein